MWVWAWSPCTKTDQTIHLSYSELFPGIQPCTSATQNSLQVSNHLPQIRRTHSRSPNIHLRCSELTSGLQTSASTQNSLQVFNHLPQLLATLSKYPAIRLSYSNLSLSLQPCTSATQNSLQVSNYSSPLLRTLSRFLVICFSYSELSPGLQRSTSAAQNSLSRYPTVHLSYSKLYPGTWMALPSSVVTKKTLHVHTVLRTQLNSVYYSDTQI
jgi:hypothetical protein